MNEEASNPADAEEGRLGAEHKLTAQIRLGLTRDEALYLTCQKMTQAHLAARDTCGMCGGSGEGPVASERDCEQCKGAGVLSRSSDQLGDELKGWCEELTLERESGAFRRQILSTALDLVDWAGLADDYIREQGTDYG